MSEDKCSTCEGFLKRIEELGARLAQGRQRLEAKCSEVVELRAKLEQTIAGFQHQIAEAAVMREALIAVGHMLDRCRPTRTLYPDKYDEVNDVLDQANIALSTDLSARGKAVLNLIDAVNALLATSDDADYHRLRSKLVEARDNLACTPPVFDDEQPKKRPHG